MLVWVRSMSTPAAPASSVKWIWLVFAVVVTAGIALMPTPMGLTRLAHITLAIIAGTVVLWAAEVLNQGVASMLMIAAMITAGVPPPLALSGFSDGAWWTLLVVVYYGFAMKKTGLAERVAYYILSLFPGTFTGILTAFFLIGFVLALGIPSMTVRTAIMAPIAWSLVQSLGLPPRSRSAGLVMITVIEMAVVPGLAFELGSLNGPIVVSMFAAKKLPLTWGSYAQFMTLPTLVMCGLILALNQILLKPEAPIKASRAFATDKLASMGPFKQQEMLTALVVLASIGFWVTNPTLHKLPTFVVGMFGLGVLTLGGIIKDSDIGTGVSWTILLFLGGIFSLTHVIPEYKITDWIASLLVPQMQPLIGSPIALLTVAALMMLGMRFIDPSAFIVLPLIWTPLVDAVSAAGIPPLALAAPLLLCSAPFWLPYMNFWMAMGDGITGKQGFTKGQLAYLGTIYAAAAIIATAVGVVYWRLMGLMH